MASREQQPPAPGAEGIELSTLVLSAIASACAAYVTSKVWANGTLISAAMSPVIVALVKEGLRRPTEVVTSAVPTRVRRPRPGEPAQEASASPTEVRDALDLGAPPPHPPPAPGAEAGPVNVYSTGRRRLHWRIAIITGLLGFGICVLLYTVPELIAGQSVSRSGRATTLWGGRHGTSTRSTTTTTSTTPAATTPAAVTPTTPAQTETAPVQTTTTPPVQTTTEPSPGGTTAPPDTATPPASSAVP